MIQCTHIHSKNNPCVTQSVYKQFILRNRLKVLDTKVKHNPPKLYQDFRGSIICWTLTVQ